MASSSSQPGSGTDGRIQISVVAGDAFVWSTEHIERLRCEHGIVGLLVGSLPLIPQQNVFLGVPLQLFEEEVVYLLRKGVAVLVDDMKAHMQLARTIPAQELRAWHLSRDEAIRQSKRQILEQAQQSKAQWEQHAASKGKAVEKRKEREKRREIQRQEGGDVDQSKSESVAKQTEEEGLRNMSHPVTVATSSAEFPWAALNLGVNVFDTLSSAAKVGLWLYPSNAEERARCAVFEDLRERGYYMGKGLRFGGDFVVYPGDPLRYHSHFTATIQSAAHVPMAAQELVAAGRLGTAVKKAHLLCTVALTEADKGAKSQFDKLDAGRYGSVDYFSLTWAGFGT